MTTPSTSPDGIGAGAPGNEIEITPEMIEAGVVELVAYAPQADRPEGAVVDIFLAMLRARGKRRVKVHEK